MDWTGLAVVFAQFMTVPRRKNFICKKYLDIFVPTVFTVIIYLGLIKKISYLLNKKYENIFLNLLNFLVDCCLTTTK